MMIIVLFVVVVAVWFLIPLWLWRRVVVVHCSCFVFQIVLGRTNVARIQMNTSSSSSSSNIIDMNNREEEYDSEKVNTELKEEQPADPPFFPHGFDSRIALVDTFMRWYYIFIIVNQFKWSILHNSAIGERGRGRGKKSQLLVLVLWFREQAHTLHIRIYVSIITAKVKRNHPAGNYY